MVSIADAIVALVSAGDIRAAEEVRANRLVPVASEIAQLKRTLGITTAGSDPSNGLGVAIAVVLVLVVVGGVAVFLRRSRKHESEATASTEEARPARPPSQAATQEHRPEREWDEPHPSHPQQMAQLEPEAHEEQDTARTRRIRPREVELHSLLASTIEQIRDRDWVVSLVCPEVHISGDPIRVQRTILAAIGNAFLEGAERVGIIVDVIDGQVLVSIGHDAQVDDDTANDIAARLANQLAPALGIDELGWSVTSDGEIFLTTVSAGRSLATTAEAETAR